MNPVGTVQSIEHTLRSLDKLAADQQSRATRAEKELVDYQAQADRPFEHEERLRHLLARQAELNAALDLDKGDQQGADLAPELKDDLDLSQTPAPAEPSHDHVAKMAEVYMRASKTAIREMPISQTHTAANRTRSPVARLRRMTCTSRWRLPPTAFSSFPRPPWAEMWKSASVCLCAFSVGYRVWRTTEPEPDETSRADVTPAPPESLADRPPGVRKREHRGEESLLL